MEFRSAVLGSHSKHHWMYRKVKHENFYVEYLRIQRQIHRGMPHLSRNAITQVTIPNFIEQEKKTFLLHFNNHF